MPSQNQNHKPCTPQAVTYTMHMLEVSNPTTKASNNVGDASVHYFFCFDKVLISTDRKTTAIACMLASFCQHSLGYHATQHQQLVL